MIDLVNPAYAAPHFGPSQRDAIIDLFPSADLKEVEEILGLPSPADDFRDALALVVWKRLQDVPPDLKNAKRRIERLLAQPDVTLEDVERATNGDPGTAEEALGYFVTMSGLAKGDAAARARFDATVAGKGPNWPEHALMAGLVGIYENFTGKRAGYRQDRSDASDVYSGPFIDLVALADRVVRKKLKMPPRSNLTIGEAVKLAVSSRKSSGIR
jgi:hypothetical protein